MLPFHTLFLTLDTVLKKSEKKKISIYGHEWSFVFAKSLHIFVMLTILCGTRCTWLFQKKLSVASNALVILRTCLIRRKAFLRLWLLNSKNRPCLWASFIFEKIFSVNLKDMCEGHFVLVTNWMLMVTTPASRTTCLSNPSLWFEHRFD